MRLALTKTAVDAILPPSQGQVLYYDTKLTGFGLRVSQAKKVFFAESRVDGKTVRTTIGRYGVFTVDQAREEGRQVLSRMARGENINEAKRERRRVAEEETRLDLTLGQAFENYIAQRTNGQGKKLKSRTVEGYEWMRDHNFTDWLDLPFSAITEKMVTDRHGKITRDGGIYAANGAFRVLRTICRYTREANRRPDGSYMFPINPVDVLTRLKLWNPEARKKRHVTSNKLADWFDAVEAISDQQFRNALQTKTLLFVMVFLGFRASEAKRIELSEVETNPPSLRLLETKNSDPHFVPLGPFLGRMVAELKAAAEEEKSKFLFYSDESGSGHVHDPRKVIRKVETDSGVKFSPNDLRRTFVSMLNSMEPAPSAYTIKRLMNHRAKPSDVTAGYIQIEEKYLRDTVTRLEQWILKSANRGPSGRKLKARTRPASETS